ncbi:FabD lysophospholipase-like protein [Mycena filopes]|nr:FabD lysophospholipase-like protein [Mycena filopes]
MPRPLDLPNQESVITGVRLLSLDGGGIRGLSTLYMLQTLMYRIQREQGLEEMPLPCDYFDLIGGTSTGGLITILVGRLRMSVDDAIACYVEFSKKVFGKTKSTLALGEGKYSATIFEEVVKTLVRQRTGDTETPLLDNRALGGVCKIFVCARRAHAINHGIAELFRSYQSTNPAVACTVWQAARATSAAPTFFKQIAIGPVQEQFIDGGMGVNNPAKQLLAEADAVFPDRQIACLISIGTGWTGTTELPKPGFLERNTIPVGVIKVLKALATDSEQTAQEMQLKFAKQPKVYFRFNVDHGLEAVRLDDWQQMSKVASLTRSYADKHETRTLLDDAVTVLVNPKQCVTPTAVARINTCPPASRIFQGRQQILGKMQQFFSTNSGKQLIYVLHGLGGTGKTQTALKFIQDSDANFTNIFLVDASSIETIKISLQNIAQSWSCW